MSQRSRQEIFYCPRCLRSFRSRISYCPADGARLGTRPDDPLLGTVIGERYRIQRVIGRGGMGRVYKAEHVLMRKVLAIKLLHGELSTEPDMVERFHREARSVAQLDHPHIVRITDFGETVEGILYLVMEYLEGTDVHRLIKKEGAVPSKRSTHIAMQGLDALVEAHLAGIIHRDLKPENMMLVRYRDDPDHVKLLDFGLATLATERDPDDPESGPVVPASSAELERRDTSPGARRLTQTGIVYGTPEYMSPEQARGVHVDHRSDLYSFGVIFYNMLAGVPPFRSPRAVDVLSKHVLDAPKPLKSHAPDVPDALAELVHKTLSKDPWDRYQSATEMLEVLTKVSLDEGWDATLRGAGVAHRRKSQAEDIEPEELRTGAAGSPRRFGRYVLSELLARGGMGEVWLARSGALRGLAKPCVVKRLLPELTEDSDFVARFVEEIKVAARLDHGNITQVFDMGRVEKTYYVAMEYVEGKNLRQVLNRAREEQQRMPLEVALSIGRDLMSALSYAHRHTDEDGRPLGLVHRDISPHNVMVSYAGEVKLVDFGLAIRAAQERRTKAGIVLGKLRYLSPEQAHGKGVDRRSDIYSAGVVLYELLVGEPMFAGANFDDVASAVRSPRPRPPSESNPEVPIRADHIILKALHPNPDMRYQYAEEMRDDLSQHLAEVAPRMSDEAVGGFLRGLFANELARDLGRADRAKRARVSTVPPGETTDTGSLLPERAADWEKSASITIKRPAGVSEETGAILLVARGKTPIWPYAIAGALVTGLVVGTIALTNDGGSSVEPTPGTVGSITATAGHTAFPGTAAGPEAHLVTAEGTYPAPGETPRKGEEAEDAAERMEYRKENRALVRKLFLLGLEPTDLVFIPGVADLEKAHIRAAREGAYAEARALLREEATALHAYEIDKAFLKRKLASERRRYERARKSRKLDEVRIKYAEAFFKTMPSHMARASTPEQFKTLNQKINALHSRLYGKS